MDRPGRQRVFGRAADERAGRQRVDDGQRDVFADRLRPDQALQAAVFGDVGDAEVARHRRAGDRHRLAVEFDPACRGRRDAEQDVRQLGAARPDQPGNTQNLAGMQRERGVLHPCSVRQALDLQQRLAQRGMALRVHLLDRAADHQRHQALVVDLADRAGGHQAAVAQHRHAVGQREDLGHAVADVDDADAARAQAAHHVEQALHVGLGQCRGGLVHHQHARRLRQRACDLDALPVRHRQRADLGIDVEFEALQRVEQLARAEPQRGPVDGAQPTPRRVAEENILGHRQLGKQQQFLVHRGDPGGARLARRREAAHLAVYLQLAGVGVLHARHDLDQGRLAGAVFTQQRMHFAGPHIEAHAVDRAHAAKGLRDADQFEGSAHDTGRCGWLRRCRRRRWRPPVAARRRAHGSRWRGRRPPDRLRRRRRCARAAAAASRRSRSRA